MTVLTPAAEASRPWPALPETGAGRPTITRLTDGDGESHSPEVSDDGRVIAYIAQDPAGRPRLGVWQAGDRGGSVTVGPRIYDLGALSGNGRFVTYTSRDQASGHLQVFRRDLATTRSVQLTRGNGDSLARSITDDGAVVAFMSSATNLTREPAGPGWHSFVWSANEQRISAVGPAGIETANPTIAGSGRRIALLGVFGEGTAARTDVLLWDRRTGHTRRVTRGNADSSYLRISDDGSRLAFSSLATDLTPEPDRHPGFWDLFTWDLATGSTTRVTDGDERTYATGMSDSGRLVSFDSMATNLVEPDEPATADAFVYSTSTGRLRRVLTCPKGSCMDPTLTGTGNVLIMSSDSPEITPGDDNDRTDIFRVAY
ncbi:hypothetical protein GCM10027569_64830 [Flindersiella endophytica]